MILQNTFTQKLNELYRPNQFKDYCCLGLVVEGKQSITKGITAVSFSLEIVKKAIELEADFIIVHHPHGFWDNQKKKITLGFKEKLSLLLQYNINLYAYHLPMDAHLDIGNNIGLLKELNLSFQKGFLPMNQHFIGLIGSYQTPIHYLEFKKIVEEKIGTLHFDFNFGKKFIKKVAICTGGASGSIEKAHEIDSDIFITGEAKEDTFIFCQDYKFNFIAAGHHNTEIFGPKLLSIFLNQQWNIKTQFVNILNPV